MHVSSEYIMGKYISTVYHTYSDKHQPIHIVIIYPNISANDKVCKILQSDKDLSLV